MDIPHNHVIANGPEELARVLGEFVAHSKRDPAFAKKDHFILYQVGGQKSSMLVDFTQTPFYVGHYDLMGRPATVALKEAIKLFPCEMRDVSGAELTQRNKEFIEFGSARVDVTVAQHSVSVAQEKLIVARNEARLASVLTKAVGKMNIPEAKPSSGIRLFSLFSKIARVGKREEPAPPLHDDTSPKKKPII